MGIFIFLQNLFHLCVNMQRVSELLTILSPGISYLFDSNTFYYQFNLHKTDFLFTLTVCQAIFQVLYVFIQLIISWSMRYRDFSQSFTIRKLKPPKPKCIVYDCQAHSGGARTQTEAICFQDSFLYLSLVHWSEEASGLLLAKTGGFLVVRWRFSPKI